MQRYFVLGTMDPWTRIQCATLTHLASLVCPYTVERCLCLPDLLCGLRPALLSLLDFFQMVHNAFLAPTHLGPGCGGEKPVALVFKPAGQASQRVTTAWAQITAIRHMQTTCKGRLGGFSEHFAYVCMCVCVLCVCVSFNSPLFVLGSIALSFQRNKLLVFCFNALRVGLYRFLALWTHTHTHTHTDTRTRTNTHTHTDTKSSVTKSGSPGVGQINAALTSRSLCSAYAMVRAYRRYYLSHCNDTVFCVLQLGGVHEVSKLLLFVVLLICNANEYKTYIQPYNRKI